MPSPDQKAFSLLEVLAALVIFSMAAVVLAASYLNVLNSYEVARRENKQNEGVTFARSQLLAEPDLKKAEAGAEFDDGDRHVTWSSDIEQAATTDLFTVTFTCEINDPTQSRPEKTVETFMLLRPTWSDPTVSSNLRQAAATRIAKLNGTATP